MDSTLRHPTRASLMAGRSIHLVPSGPRPARSPALDSSTLLYRVAAAAAALFLAATIC